MEAMKDIRVVDARTPEVVVCDDGHVIVGKRVEILHSCGKWTRAQGNYCTKCGQRLYPESEDI